MRKIITRFAPSPTGNPHVGNIRTAIFNYLFAKRQNGKFLFRIEDTDRDRFVPETIDYIEESLKWLNIKCDNERRRQSDYLSEYQEHAESLIKGGLAYKCFCTTERLDAIRKEQVANKLPPAYDKQCRTLGQKEIDQKEKSGSSFVVRFAMPEKGSAEWEDLIRGDLSIKYSTQDDFVLIKSDGWPTYNLASVVDDHEMKITHVIRGEEFISSTPKHIKLYESFGWQPPQFAHLPLILGSDKTKLSKRHGDTAILDYRSQGYLSEAVLNFLVLLGWNDGTEKEIFSHKELIKSFCIERIGRSAAVFDIEKLRWMNGIYIRQLEEKELLRRTKELLKGEKIVGLQNFDRVLRVEKTRLNTLCDITKETEFYLSLPAYSPNLLVFKKSTPQSTLKGLEAVFFRVKDDKWPKSIDGLDKMLFEITKKENLKNGDVFWPVRVALSGKDKSPSPAELLWVFDRKESLSRIEAALKKIKRLIK